MERDVGIGVLGGCVVPERCVGFGEHMADRRGNG
jgi:hypothetical protein